MSAQAVSFPIYNKAQKADRADQGPHRYGIDQPIACERSHCSSFMILSSTKHSEMDSSLLPCNVVLCF